jgi:hypothetical protein
VTVTQEDGKAVARSRIRLRNVALPAKTELPPE